jgi:cytochrome b
MGLHIFAGYAIVALLAFRLVWGVFGPEYSRLVALVSASRRLGEHLRGLLLLRPKHHAGHNPAGSIMILSLFLVLTALAATGLMVVGGEEKQGPLAAFISFQAADQAKPVHFWLACLLLVMIAGHVAGVLVEGFLLGAPLIRGMIHGWLPIPEDLLPTDPRRARPAAALATIGVMALVAATSFAIVARLKVPNIPKETTAVMKSECGSCHWAYHPSLLPRHSWAVLMADLGDHFGEDASLPADTAREIAAYLDANAAEVWDTEAAKALVAVSPDQPTRITASPFWIAKHAGITAAAFAAPNVRVKNNCIGCHSDADTGRFDDQAILPTEQRQKGIDQ